MKINVYTIHDSAPNVFNRPFYCQSDAEALRMFDDMAVDAEHPIGQHPEHYTLFRIGTYEQNTGELAPEKVTSIATATARAAAQQRIEPGELKTISAGGTA